MGRRERGDLVVDQTRALGGRHDLDVTERRVLPLPRDDPDRSVPLDERLQLCQASEFAMGVGLQKRQVRILPRARGDIGALLQQRQKARIPDTKDRHASSRPHAELVEQGRVIDALRHWAETVQNIQRCRLYVHSPTSMGDQERPDDDLLHGLASRDLTSLGVLYDRYSRPMFALAYRILGDGQSAEDVVQDAFLAAWRGVDTFRRDRGTVRNWLLSITHHRAVDVLRRRTAFRPTTLEAVESRASDADTFAEADRNVVGK